ncbi:replication factor A [Salinarchaeum sp. Harcht-Bsk1]|uniref:single-stranded DNA binding protein n=1 Tax=Salinarchaeum sp. Harcht-Bsk1 TaxID=1333523 RepID=UPI00034243CA|nr:single-stranded DNA binding protein [Salinarchaeum sp. Harcht-Bsk1]AGN00288.1 replication factor A [Salinarchaeum sp. Harcht-Bsk1]
MGVIEEIHEDLEADVELAEFRDAVEERVERMGGLADEETAAMLVAHELDEDGGEVEGVAEIEAGMEEVKFVAKVVSVGELKTFERDDDGSENDDVDETEAEEEPAAREEGAAQDEQSNEGRVLNAEVADETGQIRVAFWDALATDAAERMERGDVVRIAGRPAEGYRGLEVNVDKAEPDPGVEVDVDLEGTTSIDDLTLGRSDVNVEALVLDTESVRTFDRDDGSEGKVSNLALGDPSGRIRATLWDGMADRAEELEPGTSVEVVDGYVRERDGDLELHVGERGAVEEIDESVEYEPDSTPIGEVEIDQQVDLVGVVRSADPKRTFDRDDGSEGQVRNVRVQDDSGDIRVALWGDKADLDISPGDELALADVEIQDGWQDDLEASAGWQAAVTVLERDDGLPAGGGGTADGDADLSAFGDDGSGDSGDEAASEGATDDAESSGAERPVAEAADATAEGPGAQRGTSSESVDDADDDAVVAVGETVEFTGVVVQAGDPIILDDGEQTVRVDADADIHLGDEITVRGEGVEDDRIAAADVF